MCGIVGLVGYGDEALIRRMSDALSHRGPDGEGYYVDSVKRVYLGHRRLAVLDITSGLQPMWNQDRSIGVIFNGEIYNHLELRNQLTRLGHRFTSDHSDTEVLVHGYREWGESLPIKLNGMFSFAVIDKVSNTLFLARDRFGEKPLFYSASNGQFAFASELGPLLVSSVLPEISLDRTAIKKYLAYGLFPGSVTPYQGIKKLPGGYLMSVDLITGVCTQRDYWRFRIEPTQRRITARVERDLAAELRDLLECAVRNRMESDVPLGVFLSGGMDSSAILSFAARYVEPGALQAFTIGFMESSFDETPYASTVAKHVDCRHRVEICSLESARNRLESLQKEMGEPLGDPSILPTALLCDFARKHVTVALSGDGGDELFFGYDPFKAVKPGKLYFDWVPSGIKELVRRLVDVLPVGNANMALDFKLKRTLRGLSYAPSYWAPVWMGALDSRELDELFQEKTDIEEVYSDAIEVWRSCASENELDRLAEFFTCFYLSDGVLTKVDRMSMRVGLEVRAPFLDQHVVEFARRLPTNLKFRHGQGKYLLKKALEGILPQSILNRRKKGFGIPLAKWIGDFEIPNTVARKLNLNIPYLDNMFEQHRMRRSDFRHALYCMMALEHGLGGARGSNRLES